MHMHSHQSSWLPLNVVPQPCFGSLPSRRQMTRRLSKWIQLQKFADQWLFEVHAKEYSLSNSGCRCRWIHLQKLQRVYWQNPLEPKISKKAQMGLGLNVTSSADDGASL